MQLTEVQTLIAGFVTNEAITRKYEIYYKYRKVYIFGLEKGMEANYLGGQTKGDTVLCIGKVVAPCLSPW